VKHLSTGGPPPALRLGGFFREDPSMNRVHSDVRPWHGLMLGLLAPVLLWAATGVARAQGGSHAAPSHAAEPYRGGGDGPYVIQHARYGTAERNVDVTAALRDLARRDERFRLDNDTFAQHRRWQPVHRLGRRWLGAGRMAG